MHNKVTKRTKPEHKMFKTKKQEELILFRPKKLLIEKSKQTENTPVRCSIRKTTGYNQRHLGPY